MCTCCKWYAFEDGDSVLGELVDLVGVVGEEAHRLKPKVVEDRSRGRVVTTVRGEAEREVRVERVQAGFLQSVGLELVDESDAATFVAAHVDHDAAVLIDRVEGGVELWAALTFLGLENLAGQTFRVHADKAAVGCPAGHDGEMFAAGDEIAVGAELESAVLGRNSRFNFKPDT